MQDSAPRPALRRCAIIGRDEHWIKLHNRCQSSAHHRPWPKTHLDVVTSSGPLPLTRASGGATHGNQHWRCLRRSRTIAEFAARSGCRATLALLMRTQGDNGIPVHGDMVPSIPSRGRGDDQDEQTVCCVCGRACRDICARGWILRLVRARPVHRERMRPQWENPNLIRRISIPALAPSLAMSSSRSMI